ncbi:MAG: hypothetical protein ACKVT2_23105 [Saprospiraceae bacterium]
MEKTKLLQLLSDLNAWELRNLEQFLRSPFHNQREDVLRLFEFYKTQHSKKRPDFSDAAACRAVWPDKDLDTVDYPNLRSYLFKLTEKYLACEEIFRDEVLLKMSLSKAYKRRNKDHNFEQTIRDIKVVLEKQPLRNPAYLRKAFEVEYEVYDYIASRSRMEETNIEAVGKMLDAHYFAEKLKLACAQQSLSKIRPQDYDLSILPEVLAFLADKPDWVSYPAVAIYYHAFLTLTDQNNETHFQEVRRLLQDCRDQFMEREIGDVYRICLNYCIKRSNQGELHYTREGFDLYRLGIEHGYLLKEGQLSHHSYTNAAAFGITLREYEWAERFIQDHQNKVSHKHRESAFHFCLARLWHAKGNYPEAMRLLAEFNTDDPYYYLIAKKMLCKIFYEGAEIAPLESLLDSMRVYLKRHGLDGDIKAHFKLFVDLIWQILKLPPYDSKAKTKLLVAIDKLPLFVDKEWFLKQLK